MERRVEMATAAKVAMINRNKTNSTTNNERFIPKIIVVYPVGKWWKTGSWRGEKVSDRTSVIETYFATVIKTQVQFVTRRGCVADKISLKPCGGPHIF
jgi:hypothetical protein